MGLDMYAYTREKGSDAEPVRLHYWRKHPDLHGWMEEVYRERGGTEDFNCIQIELFPADLDRLETDIKERVLPDTAGFFFGDSDGSETEDDLEFVENARTAIKEGKQVFYDSWW